ncbi:MAG: hypothetical protein JXB26_11455 [Candidatus Aminicenantes bacterium]|nr:hypothetical protein [Candidatus Aminicenantes bacterium]
MKKRYEIKESKDESCPYCRSSFVMKTEIYDDDEFVGKIPKGCVVFRCYTCNKLFYCRKT